MKTLITVKGPITSFNIQGSGVTFKSNPGSLTFVVSGTGPQGPQGVPGTPAPTRKFVKITGHLETVVPNYIFSYNEDFNNTGNTFDVQFQKDNNNSFLINTDSDIFKYGNFLLTFLSPLQFNTEAKGPQYFRPYDEPGKLMIQMGDMPPEGENIIIIIEDITTSVTA